jgi:hypothetical protein
MPHLTIGQLADLLHEPEWKVRREVDALGVEIPRAGLYRLVPRELVPRLVEQLDQREHKQEATNS